MSLKTYLQEQESLLNNFKVKNNLAPNIMKDVFQFREPLCNLSSVMSAIMTRKVTTICHGLSSATHLVPGEWEEVSKVIQYFSSLNKIKKLIKSWVSKQCL